MRGPTSHTQVVEEDEVQDDDRYTQTRRGLDEVPNDEEQPSGEDDRLTERCVFWEHNHLNHIVSAAKTHVMFQRAPKTGDADSENYLSDGEQLEADPPSPGQLSRTQSDPTPMPTEEERDEVCFCLE